jgi:hypothetical protein
MVEPTSPRALIAFHAGTALDPLLTKARWRSELLPLQERQEANPSLDVDLFVLLVDTRSGISPAMVELWNLVQERQVPRAMLVQGIATDGADFDDIVLIGNRILEKFATPYLVLHDEKGAPIGLIRLKDEATFDYSNENPILGQADRELRALVHEFRVEYIEEFLSLGEDGFAAGIYPIALPIDGVTSIGLAELNLLLGELATR